MVDRIMGMEEGTRAYLLAPIVRDRKGEYRKEFMELRKQGFQRVKVDGAFYELEEPPTLDKKLRHDIDVVVDRLVVKEGMETRLADSLSTALDLADGIAILETAPKEGDPERTTFSRNFACPVSGFTIPEIEPRLFSFNAPFGACPACDGLGVEMVFDERLIVPDESKSLNDGAIAPWAKSGQPSPYYRQTMEAVAKHCKVSVYHPWRDLPAPAKKLLLYGSDGKEIQFVFDDGGRVYKVKRAFEGVIPNLERRWKETGSDQMREEFERYQTQQPCDACGGHRLKPEALSVKIETDGGALSHIGEVTRLSIREAAAWAASIEKHLSKNKRDIAKPILKEINERLGFLVKCRARLFDLVAKRRGRSRAAKASGSAWPVRSAPGLTGVLYVLDEPSIGLHQRDNDRLLATLKNLRDAGNTVIVVEHDEEAMLEADYLVDIGPGAGVHGGRIIAEGTPADVAANETSITGDYLAGRRAIEAPAVRREGTGQWVEVVGATGNNLRNATARIPIGAFTCVTGVSGGGKSTFTIETLYKTAAQRLNGARGQAAPCETIKGLEYLDKVIDIDQSPIGRTPRSNPATYTGAFTPIRDWFAGLPEAKTRGYKPGRFSFNVKGGRCEACQGDGVIKIEMHFLADVYVTCDVCNGARYNRETLEIKYRDKSIADVLAMTVEDGAEFFKAVPMIRDKLETLKEVGLGYIKIGQQATTLSGGEAQRVKLSKELAKRATGQTLYIPRRADDGSAFRGREEALACVERAR